MPTAFVIRERVPSFRNQFLAAAGGAGFRILAAGRGVGVGNAARLRLHGKHAKLQKMKGSTRRKLRRYKKHQNRPHAHIVFKKKKYDL